MGKTDATERGRFKLTRALIELTCRHTFHASIIMRLQRTEDVACLFPMGTDGVRLWTNPQQLADMTIDEIEGVLAHEAMHVAGRHPLRMEWRTDMVMDDQGRVVTLWNIACDHVVNQQVGEAGLSLPVGCVPPLKNETPEHLYPKLQEQASKLPKLAYGAGACGDMQSPKHEDGTPYSHAEKQELAQQTKQWVEAAATAAKRAGQLDTGLERFVKRELRSVVPWREVLTRFVSEKRLSDYSWQRPNKRYTSFGIYLPKLEARDVPRVAIFGDASGSMSPPLLQQVGAEVFAVLELRAGGESVELPIGWFDSALYMQFVSDPREIKIQGGGGTDYAPCMTWLTKHAEEYGVRGAVVVTDGECSSFGAAPPCDVLWVLTNERNEAFAPPFGELALVLSEAT